MDDNSNDNKEIPTSSTQKEISHSEMLASFLTNDYLNEVNLRGTDGIQVPANRFLLAARSETFLSSHVLWKIPRSKVSYC
jgi:hypothetical protein